MLYLRMLLEGLVDYPSSIALEKRVDELGVLLSIKVDPQDMGKVVGRQGATAKAIRTLMHAAGKRENAQVSLKFNEPEGRNAAA